MKLIPAFRLVALACVVALWSLALARADEASKGEHFTIGEGKFQMPLPAGWVAKEPRVRFIEHEFEIPAAEGDDRPGRATVMGAGGTVEENIKRWAGQFSQPDGSDTREKVKTENKTIAGQPVTIVDISGTYEDKPPFSGAPGVQRENYRMLSAIISLKGAGNYFVKFYGPKATVGGQEANFIKMLEGLEAK
jgi:hypothetical protein